MPKKPRNVIMSALDRRGVGNMNNRICFEFVRRASLRMVRSFLGSSLILLVLIGPFASSANAEPGYRSKCTHQQFLAKTMAQASDGTWWKCDRSDIAEGKNGEYIRIYGWSKTKNPTSSSSTLDTKARPMAVCTQPGKTVKTANYGRLKCLPMRVNPKLVGYFWIKI